VAGEREGGRAASAPPSSAPPVSREQEAAAPWSVLSRGGGGGGRDAVGSEVGRPVDCWAVGPGISCACSRFQNNNLAEM
jgi:hypothetical protein